MIIASISGRMAFDARVITTKSGKPMTTARLACGDDDGNTIWIDVVAFTSNAEWLARAAKGDRIAAYGYAENELLAGQAKRRRKAGASTGG